jgi:hypothetical protein
MFFGRFLWAGVLATDEVQERLMKGKLVLVSELGRLVAFLTIYFDLSGPDGLKYHHE